MLSQCQNIRWQNNENTNIQANKQNIKMQISNNISTTKNNNYVEKSCKGGGINE